ncbi:type VI secretion system-associated FHA domain protein TagH [Pantoea phytobeneficialis]|uniref:Type VI secretion system-associated FHA domain protein TagH n=1 Tax=Pantoea phytobeneficialis TaxID=2052056 RepID=A0AAP9H769_9GAMM|nr:type VI secretion system-associated FHA domain protein TagH [Pantoea phytobeneficialis]MDO6405335.1 type VI secretion system-associated FHA domain protein TagH [Pantoea phytobeneficialis]QGR07853.1 type VI secretion system-associated FHA domain protein TagH [Pantoea phytobeneficialis]
MRFTIITTKPGHQPPQTLFDFLPPGGTIGRGVDNNLVLPDDDRTISRLQAIVHISADGECRLTNRGNVTRVLLNDIPLERGRQVELQDGDILGIDDYQLLVNDIHAAQPASSVPKPAAKAAIIADEPPAVSSNTAAIPSEIWDSLAKEFSISDDLSQRNKPVPASSEAHPLTAPAAVERNPEDPLAALISDAPLDIGQQPTTHSLFDEGDALFAEESIFDDATPSALVGQKRVAAPTPVENPTAELDPLSLFGSQNTPDPRHHDDPLGLMMGGAVPLAQPEVTPAAIMEPEPLPVPEPEPAPEPESEPEPESADVSPTPLEYGGITLPTPQAVQRTPSPTPKGRLRIDPVASSSQREAAAQSSGDALKGELLDALLEGMGLQDLQPTPQFDRDQMRQFGQMLSMFSQGTVALLSSRSILKRGVKADMTVILDDANNPFKLLPSGKTVLMQMFGSRMPGFMPPRQAVRDALIDLQAHQLGMIAGIRAIIASMLQSFNPDQLEEEAREAGSVSRLALPGSRKAALWEHFVERYGETAGEIEDDFHTLFGEAFLHAYDMEVNQYKDSQTHTDDA